MSECIFAFTPRTPANGHPEYLSIKRRGHGEIGITVRGDGGATEGYNHPVAEMILPVTELPKLIEALHREIARFTSAA